MKRLISRIVAACVLIVCSSPVKAQSSNPEVIANRSIARLHPWLDVSDYGAKGDSSSDDTAAITAAINAACTTTTALGGFAMHPAVVFPPGIYRVQQPQKPSASPIFVIPCTFLELRGFPGGSATLGGDPASQITVITGASPNAAPMFLVSGANGASGIRFHDLSMQGYNQAVWVRSTTNIVFDDAPMTVNGNTGLADNAALKITNSFWIWRINRSATNTIGSLTTPTVLYTAETPLGSEAPLVGLIYTEDNIDHGGAERYVQRVAPGGSGSGNFVFKNTLLEGGNNGFMQVLNTSGAYMGAVGPWTFDHVAVADATITGVGFLSISDSFSKTGALSSVFMNHVGGQFPIIKLIAGHIIGDDVIGCYSSCNNSDVVDVDGNAAGTGRVTEQWGAMDHTSDNSYEIAHPTAGLFYGAPTIADRWCSSGSAYCSLGADPNFGFLFGIGDSNAFSAGLRQMTPETLDIQFARTLPPTTLSGTPTAGGSLAAGSYYAAAWTSSSALCNELTSAATYATKVVVDGPNNAINFAWTTPIATISTKAIAGYCLHIQTTPMQISGVIGTGLFVSGKSTTSFLYTGQSQTKLQEWPANQMQSAHRFTYNSLGIGTTTPAFNLDVNGNAGIRGHIDQGATGQFAGTCTMSASTSCTIMLANAYTRTPGCLVTVQSTTVIAGSCTVSGTTVTVRAASSNSSVWAAMLFGNPN